MCKNNVASEGSEAKAQNLNKNNKRCVVSGKLQTEFNRILVPKNVQKQVIKAHNPNPKPKFGGEVEVMLMHPPKDGQCEPVGYKAEAGKAGMQDFFTEMTDSKKFHSAKDIDGQDVLLHGDDKSVLCFENYAAVIERADRAYDQENGLSQFALSVDSFVGKVSQFAQKNDFVINPFDFDVFCPKESFEGKNAPSDRFGDDGLLSQYDDNHPLTDDIDRRTTSAHFSVGYKDMNHLWRQTRILTMLVPGLYAAFAGAPPTVEVEKDGQKTILPKKDALEALDAGEDIKIGDQLLVPRAHLWTLSDPERTGINPKVAELVCDQYGDFGKYINAIMDMEVILYGQPEEKRTFTDYVKDKYADSPRSGMSTDDYMSHVSTLWYDVRIDLIRTEARMAGHTPWKSKAVGALLSTILLNDDAMDQVEQYLDGLKLKPQDILDARANVGRDGLKTQMGGPEKTVQEILKQVTEIATTAIKPENKKLLEPLQTVLQLGKSDSDILAEMELELGGDYTPFLQLDYAALKPFVQMKQEGQLDFAKAQSQAPAQTQSKKTAFRR